MESIINEPKPHFYEYMEIQLLQSYIQRGIGYFITSISNSSDSLVWLRYYSDEIGFLLDLLKDVVCLWKYDATYAEQFYGLERKSLTEAKPINKKLKILYHALVTTFIPYLLNKVEKHYNNLIEEEQNEGRVLTMIEKIFTRSYPYLHFFVSAIQTLMKFKYLLIKEERVFDLHYKLARTSLSYKQARMQQAEEGKTHYPWMDLVKTPGLLAIMLGHKVLAWYFAQKNQRNLENINDNGDKKVSPAEKYLSPMSALDSKKDYINNKQNETKNRKETIKGLCPICSKPINNPTVIKQTGNVYCYSCITDYVRENRRCPITNILISQENLQLVYSSQ